MQFFENYLGYVSNLSNTLGNYGAPVHLIAEQAPDFEHGDLRTFIADKVLSGTDMIVFDDNATITVRELRKAAGITKLRTSEEWDACFS
jgi:hypothetical protein